MPLPQKTSPILFKQPFTDMEALQEIQLQFSPWILSPTTSSYFAINSGVYLLSNDAINTKDYWPTVNTCFAVPEPTLFTLLYKEKQRKQQKSKVGIVIGNGNILSLLDQLPIEAVLLLDIEPVVHYFIWYARSLILAVDRIEDFNTIKDDIISKMGSFRFEGKGRFRNCNKVSSILKDIKSLGNLHFLANEERFRICQKALRTKPLLPVKVDIFDQNEMFSFSNLLRKNMKVSFINISNVADYDQECDLLESLKRLPVTKNCKIVFTSLCGSHIYDFMSPPMYPNKTFVCDGLDDLFKQLSSYTYKRCLR